MNPSQDRSRQPCSEAHVHQPVQLPDRHRPDRHRVQQPPAEGSLQAQRNWPRARRPGCRHHRHRFHRQPAQGELQHPRRRRIQPLKIIDPHHNRRRRRDGAQHPQHPSRHRVRVGTSFGAQERGLHGSALRTGQPLDRLVYERAEQVTNGNVGKTNLSLGGPGRQHSPRPVTGQVESSLPQRRLADAGISLDDHHPRTRPPLLKQPRHRGELCSLPTTSVATTPRTSKDADPRIVPHWLPLLQHTARRNFSDAL